MSSLDFAGRYRLLERIGQGGMAEVHRAVAMGAAGWEREVVVKRMLPGQAAADPRLAALFLEEARILAKLNHPHIAQVLDVGEAEGGIFLVMEYIAGSDLRQVMSRHRRALEPPLACVILRDVCEALDYGYQLADEHGVPLKLIHRDISLSNIMIAQTGVVKLVDFGLAKALTAFDREQTADGVIKGKWTYVAPEVLKGLPADHRSDLFSVGVCLYEMLVGRKLYKQANHLLLAVQERETPPPPPSQVADGISRELDALVLKALAPDPALRFQRAEELAAALDDLAHRWRMRPHHLTEFMGQLFRAKRLAATEQMNAVRPDDPEEYLPTDPSRPAAQPLTTPFGATAPFAPPSSPSLTESWPPAPLPPAIAAAPAYVQPPMAKALGLTPLATSGSEETRISASRPVAPGLPTAPHPKVSGGGTVGLAVAAGVMVLLLVLLTAIYFLR